MWLTVDDIRAVFWVAVIPAVLAVALSLAFGVREPEETRPARPARFPLHWDELKVSAALSGSSWRSSTRVQPRAVFGSLPHSQGATPSGCRTRFAPLVLVAMNVVYAAASYPAGVFSDRGDRVDAAGRRGSLLLIVADAALALRASRCRSSGLGVALWGLHMGLTQGLFAALVADSAPAALRGTAFGVFNLDGRSGAAPRRALRPERSGTSTAPPPLSPRGASLRRLSGATASRQKQALTLIVQGCRGSA